MASGKEVIRQRTLWKMETGDWEKPDKGGKQDIKMGRTVKKGKESTYDRRKW
ncbi:MAG: hypothetical protein HFH05_09500 [Lachnospiraceae bacterium]|nr:hypothetical protein [Lachnospiraceae bacterium]